MNASKHTYLFIWVGNDPWMDHHREYKLVFRYKCWIEKRYKDNYDQNKFAKTLRSKKTYR